MANFDKAIKVLLVHEGGLTNDSGDRGGITNYGISLRYIQENDVMDADVNHDGILDSDDIRAMSEDIAVGIYRKYWWDKPQYRNIQNDRVATAIFSCAINMGAGTAHKLLQRACNALGAKLTTDGIIGAKTFGVINSLDGDKLMNKFKEQCKAYYEVIIKRRPVNAKFRKGWYNRVNSY